VIKWAVIRETITIENKGIFARLLSSEARRKSIDPWEKGTHIKNYKI
jgi:hypothetical protein